MTDLTETTEMLQARLAAQTDINNTRDALLRTALALPNNLQYLANGGSFASCIVDLVRSIASARQAATRGGFAYLRASEEDRSAWDEESAAATKRETAYAIERLQELVAPLLVCASPRSARVASSAPRAKSEVSPMCPVKSVTHVPGCTRGLPS